MGKENIINGLVDNELLEICGIALRLAQVVKAFEVKLIDERKGRDEVYLPAFQANNLMNHLGETASDTIALLAKIVKERAEVNGTHAIDFPLSLFTLN